MHESSMLYFGSGYNVSAGCADMLAKGRLCSDENLDLKFMGPGKITGGM